MADDLAALPGSPLGSARSWRLRLVRAGNLTIATDSSLADAYEVRHMPNAELRAIPGVWGHFAGGGLDVNQTDTKFIDDALKELLAQEV